MTAADWLPATEFSGAAFLAVLLVLAGAAILLSRRPRPASVRPPLWILVLAGVAAVERIAADDAPPWRMTALVLAGLLALKPVVVVESRLRGAPLLSLRRQLAFTFLWVGMDPAPFGKREAGREATSVRPLVALTAGALLLAAARPAATATGSEIVAALLLLPALSLILHFGLCNLLAQAWRRAGFAVQPVFRAPLRSRSLGEFWGQRWNRAFSEMAAIAVHRPLAGRVGRGPARLAAFLASGLLHEMALSLPVRAGFGLPLAYFLLHGGLVAVEERFLRRNARVSGALRRAWTLVAVALPAPLLFHPPFLRAIVLPLAGL